MRKRMSLMIFIFFLFTMTTNLSAQERAADPDPLRFQSEIEAFIKWDLKNSSPTDALLFIGSSSIRMWVTRKYFPDYPVINRGFGGAHISDVLHFFDHLVLPYFPKVIVFYCGDNDIAGGKTPERVLDDYKTFVERSKKAEPNVKIIYLPIKPSLDRWHLWEQMKEANKLIKDYSETDPQLFYADTATQMLTDAGTPQPDLFADDGLHLNENGYELWTKIVKPMLEEVYGK